MSGSWLATGLGNGMLMNYGTYLKEDLMKEQQQLDIERMQRVEEIKQMLADKERGARAAEIDKGTEGLIAAKIGNRYAGSDAAVSDAAAGRTDAPLTPEQLAVIQQSKDGARGDLSMRDKLEARIEAGSKAGYDMSKDMNLLAHLTTTEASKSYHDSALDETKRHHQEIEKNVSDRTAAMKSRWENGSGGKSGREYMPEIDSKQFTANAAEIRKLTEDLRTGKITDPKYIAETEKDIMSLRQENYIIGERIRRGGDMTPNSKDIAGLLADYPKLGKAAMDRFDRFHGQPGLAESILASPEAGEKLAPNELTGGAQNRSTRNSQRNESVGSDQAPSRELSGMELREAKSRITSIDSEVLRIQKQLKTATPVQQPKMIEEIKRLMAERNNLSAGVE